MPLLFASISCAFILSLCCAFTPQQTPAENARLNNVSLNASASVVFCISFSLFRSGFRKKREVHQPPGSEEIAVSMRFPQGQGATDVNRV